MNIISAIQKHYYKRSSLLIPLSIDSVCHVFAKLATVGIVRGNRWNPFAPYYKLKVRWDGNIACLDGPYGAKMVPLTTQITIEPSMSRDRTMLDLTMQLSIRYINTSLLVTSLLAIFTICLQLKFPDKLIIFLFWVMMLYGLTWMYLFYSSNIIHKCLAEELSNVDLI
ncbi:hypothetical protein [Chamaesiphon sp. VAR_48_metabat_403]|uniref:hypothetical protein n=1 Tax=Chamaesiphon sp. VAR_48_metabat_403 TaxID=2964700 RepID=UPI00286E57D3|nr:hypothetical protein [Chamaesiphon sp. VAR_48_metabat_403]